MVAGVWYDIVLFYHGGVGEDIVRYLRVLRLSPNWSIVGTLVVGVEMVCVLGGRV